MYERVLSYYNLQRQRGLCWVRLFNPPPGTVALISEVAGNPGWSVTQAAAEVACALCELLDLPPEALTLFEHYAVDSGHEQAQYAQVQVAWRRREGVVEWVDEPTWQPVAHHAVEALVGDSLTLWPFWKPEGRAFYCKVGERSGGVWQQWLPDTRELTTDWVGMCTGEMPGMIRGFVSQQEAQEWVLNSLALMASEHDILPHGLGTKS